MRKSNKNKRGFTLLEMCLVIAIICIMAYVVFREVAPYLERAEAAEATVVQYYDEVNELVGDIV